MPLPRERLPYSCATSRRWPAGQSHKVRGDQGRLASSRTTTPPAHMVPNEPDLGSASANVAASAASALRPKAHIPEQAVWKWIVQGCDAG